MPNYARMLKNIDEWAKGLPNAEQISAMIRMALTKSGETGREYMVHQPAPGGASPIMRIGNFDSVEVHPDMKNADLWLGQDHPFEYNFHTHPAQPDANADASGSFENALLRPVPWFSGPDMSVYHTLARQHEPAQGMRFAVGSPDTGDFIGAQLRPSSSSIFAPYEETMSRLRTMDQQARSAMSVNDMRNYGKRMQGEFGLDPAFFRNVQASAPLFKTQGDLVEPLNTNFSNPSFEDVVNDYIKQSGMAHGGLYYERIIKQ